MTKLTYTQKAKQTAETLGAKNPEPKPEVKPEVEPNEERI